MKRRELEEARTYDRALDVMSAECSARTEHGASHLGCSYCRHLARVYDALWRARTAPPCDRKVTS